MRSNNTLMPNPFSSLSNQSNKQSLIGKTTNEFTPLQSSKSQNNPSISGSYNKMVGGGNDAISGLASMFGGRIPSPLEFAAQKKAGSMGYASTAQMQFEESKKRRKQEEEDKKMQELEQEDMYNNNSGKYLDGRNMLMGAYNKRNMYNTNLD